MKDILLQKMFEPQRWETLIEKSELKGISKAILRQLCKPEVRASVYLQIKNNEVEFGTSHMAQIPKDTPGEFRTVYVCEDLDRVILSIINDCLFELFPEMIHKNCKSYQKGMGTGKTVKELSAKLSFANEHYQGNVVGVKSDFHHYFDTVNLDAIMNVFDVIESKLGFAKETEPVMNMLRRTWQNNHVINLDKNIVEQYMGIRQGNAVGSFLANVILYELDEFMSNKYAFYCRYSDDCVVIHDNPEEVINDMNNIIGKYGVCLNQKKVEVLTKDHWFKFLGFSVKGNQITLSKRRVKSFQKEIEKRTIKGKISPKKALYQVQNYLYKGDGEYSWATAVLSVVNVQKDIDTMNEFVLDALRACETQKKKIGGLGVVNDKPDYTILRGTGRNVSANRRKTNKDIENFYSLSCMRKALITNRAVYDTLVRSI